jgi:hypothetical protein
MYCRYGYTVNNHYVLQEAIRHMTLNCWLQILEKNKCPEQFGPKIEAISFIVINIKIYKIVYQLHMNFGFKIYSYVVLYTQPDLQPNSPVICP